jgi:late competence protein required for DNA uptake (superfamily II DNA/RNA helicase)
LEAVKRNVTERTYRCSSCLDRTVVRDFDVSHVSVTCSGCDSFTRFINENVLSRFRTFEESPPDNLDWGSLDRAEKFLVCDQVVRSERSIEDFGTSG